MVTLTISGWSNKVADGAAWCRSGSLPYQLLLGAWIFTLVCPGELSCSNYDPLVMSLHYSKHVPSVSSEPYLVKR